MEQRTKTCGQFHQHFYAPIFLRQKSTNLKFKYKEASRKTFVLTKVAHKMLVKLTPSVQKTSSFFYSFSIFGEKYFETPQSFFCDEMKLVIWDSVP
jgi:hypothetical protein